MAKLTAVKVKRAKAGTFDDGDGLRLVVRKRAKAADAEPSRQWILRVQFQGKRMDIGLGSTKTLDLADARTEAARLRRIAKLGENPLEARRKAVAAPPPSFREVADAVHKEHAPTWRNAVHAAQWLTSLESFILPRLGKVPVDQVDAPLVRDVLADFWLTRPETARRVLQRVGVVLDYARAKGWRTAETPMQAIRAGLPKQPKQRGHHAALPWQDVPAFLAGIEETLQTSETTRLLMEFTILAAARSGESRLARWREIDREAKAWNVPASRMKGERDHRVPLTARMAEILDRMAELRTNTKIDALIFAGRAIDKPIGNNAMAKALRAAALPFTMHGFRSSFKDWSQEATSFPDAVSEAALAHTVKSKVRRAYARSDLFDRRRELMAAWEAHCLSERNKATNVMPLRAKNG